MRYINTEIFDGTICQAYYLDNTKPLEEQWKYLHDDIGGVSYSFQGLEFYVDITWMGDWSNIPDSYFRIRIFEGSQTGNTLYVKRVEPTLGELEKEFNKAIDFVLSLKKMSREQLLAMTDIR